MVVQYPLSQPQSYAGLNGTVATRRWAKPDGNYVSRATVQPLGDGNRTHLSYGG